MTNLDNNNLRLKVQKVAGRIQSNKFVGSISNGLMLTMAVTIVGSIFTLLDTMNIASYQNFLVNSGLKGVIGLPATVTVGMISLYASATIAYSLAGKYKQDGFTAALLSLMSFLLLTPLGAMADNGTGLSTRWLGAPGLFVAMIVALLVSRFYVFVIDKKIYIKMPQGVPPTVEKAFASIVPGLFITAVVITIRALFELTEYGNVHSFIYSFLQVPLTNLGGSWWAFIVTTIVGSVLWAFGIHGTMVVYSVTAPIWSALRLENLEAYQAGATELPHLAPGGVFQQVYVTLGGSGATIGLAIALLFASSKRYKTLGKLGILPSFLGINEPLMFGVPVVLNPKLIMPLILVPLTNVSLALGLTAAGILPRLKGIGSPLGTPIMLTGFIEGGWKVALFQAFLILVSFAIYYPFFKKMDAEATLEEMRLEETEQSEQIVGVSE